MAGVPAAPTAAVMHVDTFGHRFVTLNQDGEIPLSTARGTAQQIRDCQNGSVTPELHQSRQAFIDFVTSAQFVVPNTFGIARAEILGFADGAIYWHIRSGIATGQPILVWTQAHVAEIVAATFETPPGQLARVHMVGYLYTTQVS